MKYSNFFIFILSLSILLFLQSYTNVSTSLLAILPNGESKKMISTFNETQNSKVLLLAVKGLDLKALEKIQQLEKELTVFPLIDQKQMTVNSKFQKHQEEYKLFSHKINEDKLSKAVAISTLLFILKPMISPASIRPRSSSALVLFGLYLASNKNLLFVPIFGFL